MDGADVFLDLLVRRAGELTNFHRHLQVLQLNVQYGSVVECCLGGLFRPAGGANPAFVDIIWYGASSLAENADSVPYAGSTFQDDRGTTRTIGRKAYMNE